MSSMILPDTYLHQTISSGSRILTIYPNESWIYGYIQPSNTIDLNKKITKTSRILGPFSVDNSNIMLYYNIDKKRELNKIATDLVSSALRKKVNVTGNVSFFKYRNDILVDINYEDFLSVYQLYNDTNRDNCRSSKLKLKLHRLCQKFTH